MAADPVNAIERLRDLSEQAQWKCSEDPSCPDCAADTEAVAAMEALYQAAATIDEELWRAAEMRWMSVEDATIEVPARLVAEIGRAVRRIEGTP